MLYIDYDENLYVFPCSVAGAHSSGLAPHPTRDTCPVQYQWVESCLFQYVPVHLQSSSPFDDVRFSAASAGPQTLGLQTHLFYVCGRCAGVSKGKKSLCKRFILCVALAVPGRRCLPIPLQITNAIVRRKDIIIKVRLR